MRIVLLILLLAIAGAARAGGTPVRHFRCSLADAAASCVTVACKRAYAQQCPTLDDQRQTERVRRWALRKQLCREMGVRFTSSQLCW